MKRKLFYFLLLFIGLSIVINADATNLRGRVLRYNANMRQYIPLVNVRVDIWIYNGSQWVNWAYAVTGNDGMYYFYNFAPGPAFRVQVFGNFYPPQPLTLINVPLLDIPQIIT